MRIGIARRMAGALLLGAVMGSSLFAQQASYIRMREPSEWASHKPVGVRPGQRVHVSGVAWDSSGVQRVLVNGTEAQIERDGDVWSFALDIVPSVASPRIVIAALPVAGARFTDEYEILFPDSPAIRQPKPSSFGLRAFGYAGGVLAGAFLASRKSSTESVVCRPAGSGQDCFNRVESRPKYQTLGISLASASAVAGLIDFVVSRK